MVIYTLAHRPPAAEEKADLTPGASQSSATPAWDTPPAVLSKADPVFPPEAKKQHTEGIAVAKVKVDAAGHPTVLGIRGPEIFQQSVRDAVEKYSFRPATRAGSPVEAVVDVEISFKFF